nr:MAG TPA: hypothetical protein [Caudoviricetes sp.]
MFFVDEESGDITLTQGDTGEYVISGLPTDQYYTVYLAIQDENRKPVGNEISVNAGLKSSVTLSFLSSLTDLLTVKKSEDTATYYFGVKLCSQAGSEDTLVIGNKQVGERNTITVYPKKVEGLINGAS